MQILDLYESIIARLKANSALITSLAGRIYSHVPQNVSYPFARVELTAEPSFTKGDNRSYRYTCRVQIWLQQQSPALLGQLVAAVKEVLDRQEAELIIDSGQVVYCNQSGAQTVFVEPDGKTWQGVIEFSLLVDGATRIVNVTGQPALGIAAGQAGLSDGGSSTIAVQGVPTAMGCSGLSGAASQSNAVVGAAAINTILGQPGQVQLTRLAAGQPATSVLRPLSGNVTLVLGAQGTTGTARFSGNPGAATIGQLIVANGQLVVGRVAGLAGLTAVNRIALGTTASLSGGGLPGQAVVQRQLTVAGVAAQGTASASAAVVQLQRVATGVTADMTSSGQAGSVDIVAAPTTFDPLSLSPALWLDASDTATITATGGQVSQWRDKSGNSRHVSQSTGTAQPQQVASVLNGNSVVQFDGADDYLWNTQPFMWAAGRANIFVVLKAPAQSDTRWLGEGSATSTRPLYLPAQQARFATNAGLTEHLSAFYRDDNNNIFLGNQESFLPEVFQDDWKIMIWRDTGNRIDAYTDGQTQSKSYSRAGRTMTLDRFAIGSVLRSAASNHMQVEIAELLVYTSLLSDAEINEVCSYLASKWGLGWTEL